MNKRFLFILLAVSLTAFSTTGLARVSGLPDFTGLVEDPGPAVVNIRVTQFGDSPNSDQRGAQVPRRPQDMPEFFRRFFDQPGVPDRGQQPRQGAGSGFIIESDGYIITNHHVVDGADEIIVRMANRHEYKAELIGSDALSDIALLKIDADDLPTLKLGDSESLKPGEWVVAIGSPFDFDRRFRPVSSAPRGAAMYNSVTCPSSRPTWPSTAVIPAVRCLTWTVKWLASIHGS